MAVSLPFLQDLADRLDYAVKVSGLSARQLSLNAGLSHGYIGATKTRLKLGPVSIGIEEARALAKAAGVPSAWLTNNEGADQPSALPERVVETLDRYPQVTEFVAAMRQHGATEDEAAAFRARVALLKSEHGPSVDELGATWLKG